MMLKVGKSFRRGLCGSLPAARIAGPMANPDRLSGLDASFLHVEDDGAHMHVGSVLVFAGVAPGYRELVDRLESRLDLVPRYRQKLAFAPLGVGRPVWVDDPHFHADYHVRHTALPAPADEAGLKRLAGRVLAQRLDRGKPLWEIWLVDRVGDDRFALVCKTHHALVDGVSGVDLVGVLFEPEAHDGQPRSEPRPEPPWSRVPSPATPRCSPARWPSVPAAPARRGAGARRGARPPGALRRAPARRAGRPRLRRGRRARHRPAQPAERAHRPAPALRLGADRARRVPGDQGRARRNRQRRRAHRGDGRPAGPLAGPRARRRRRRAAGHGADLGARRRGARGARQPRLDRLGAAAAGGRRPARALPDRPRARWRASRSPARRSARRCSRGWPASPRPPSCTRPRGCSPASASST